MARRRESGFDVIAGLPWPIGLAFGLLAYAGIRHGIPWYLERSGGSLGKAVEAHGTLPGLALLAWVALVVCWAAALASFLGRRKRARLFDGQAANTRLAALNWREFELLVGEWFRRRGYSVQETGGGGADGGIDLRVHRDGKFELVQCKQWKRRRVDVATVREMWGLLQHHRAEAVWIVCSGEFTPDAARFAVGKPIRLITGRDLEADIRARPASVATDTAAPSAQTEPLMATSRDSVTEPCPRCGSPMTPRQNRKTGDRFLGCSAFPKCRETRPLAG